MRIHKRVCQILKGDEDLFVTPEEFRHAVDEGVWFVQALQDHRIDNWNFNFAMRDLTSYNKAVIAMRAEDEPYGGEVIDEYKGLKLVRLP